MKVKELIEELQKQNPDKEVMLQQGADLDYIEALTVKELEIWDIHFADIIDGVVIEFE